MSTGKPLEKGDKALAKGTPLEKGNKALAKATPLEKGNKALAKATRLEKGNKALAKGQYESKCQELKDRLMKSLKKGKLGPRLETGTSLEKGTAASSSNAAPLEKGASSSNAAPLEKGKKLLEKEEATALEKGQFLEKGHVAKKVAVLESKTATNKQAKSLAKGKEAAALEKGSEKKQSPEAQSEPLAVLVDWHNCLKNVPQDTVLVQDLMALQKLLDKGVEVHLL